MFPGQPGVSHSHDFFGNITTNAASTFSSLRAGGTTCKRPEDKAAYWAPTLRRGTVAITPMKAQIYYRTAGRDPATIKPFPAGFKMIAGSSHATGLQSVRVTRWGCSKEALPLRRLGNGMAICGAGSTLRLTVRFPDCWDGVQLDSADHTSHVAYSMRRVCPPDHPVAIPAIGLNVIYPVHGGRGLTLSSGPVWTAHADFFNARDQPALTALVNRCLVAARHCGRK